MNFFSLSEQPASVLTEHSDCNRTVRRWLFDIGGYRFASLLDKLLHVRFAWAELGAHGFFGLLLVRGAIISSLFIEVHDCGPTASTRRTLAELAL